MKTILSTLLALLVVAALTPSNLSAQTPMTNSGSTDDMSQSNMGDAQTIAQLAAENPDLSILVKALKATGYDQPLSDASASFTVFAPTNAAFEALPAGVLDNLMKPENANSLKYLLMYHVSPNLVRASDIATKVADADNGQISPQTLHGDLTVTEQNGKVMIKDAAGRTATVTQADIVASNGVVHVIDKVLVPGNVDVASLATDSDMAMQAMEKDAKDSSEGLWGDVKETGKEVGNAIGNAADAVANTASSAYKGAKEEVKETYNEVTTSDRDMDEDAMNTTTSTMNRSTANTGSAPDATIAEVASSNSNFSKLVTAAKSADLVNLLNSNGEFTVFAPTNAAFDALPDSTSNMLMQAGNQDMLKTLLSYHVIASKISAADLMKAIEKSNGYFRIQTISGSSLIASMDGDNVILTDGNGEYATVTDTDIEASNGIIHAIDGVLTPRN
ncbi:fasciclin domain-containing protein [Lewinella sp. IMCC34183]|uniref:fasciclin domain-containing protein n=1 Tax=Lewinella sp. IMCC34183 TaxID=2248762 RepID=UPI000E26A36F|nr:fasciclin domain-containing protein [Lewinella sp. IMCC34183]